MENTFITITGQNYCYGMQPFKVGCAVKIVKEHKNRHDDEAIRVILPYIGKIGYVANSTNTVFAGTQSAGRIYEKIGEVAYARVMFITHSSVIAQVMSPDEIDEREKFDSIGDDAEANEKNAYPLPKEMLV